MSAIIRGSRNAFRNPLRTVSVVIILGISFGLVLTMLAARTAVDNRIAEVKKSMGNTVSVSPAGARGFIGGGEPLTQKQADETAALPHVASVKATIDNQLVVDTDTNLKSPIEAGTLGGRQGRIARGVTGGNTRMENIDFTPPIFAIGTNDATYGGSMIGQNINVTTGSTIDAASDEDVVLVGKSLAEKNSLVAGSTFTAYGKTITVSGIYDAGNNFSNNSLIFPLKTLQRLSSQTDQITSIVVNVDSADNLTTVSNAVQSYFGSKADVSSSADSVAEAVKPLSSIRTIATTSLIGALVAATIITLLAMVMIVRERRKEIAVLKAIGAGDRSIITQFVTESVALSVLGCAVGTVLGLIFSNPITQALVSTSTNSGNDGPRDFATRGVAVSAGAAGDVGRIAVGGFRAIQGAVRDLNSVVSFELILYGLAAAVAVAIIGSALPTWLISKIRPAEVLRND